MQAGHEVMNTTGLSQAKLTASDMSDGEVGNYVYSQSTKDTLLRGT